MVCIWEREWIRVDKVLGERGLMGLGDCGAPSDSRPARSTIVRYHPPRYYKNKTLLNIHFSVFFMQCCIYNTDRQQLVSANSICKYYNDKIAFTLVRDKL